MSNEQNILTLYLEGDLHTYTAPRVGRYGTYSTHTAAKQQVQRKIRAMYRGEPWTGPIILLITFIRAVPKRCSKANRRQHLSGVAPPVTKPDSSNYLKFYEDCGTGILWVDDAQIVDHTVRKRYGEEEGVHIQVIRYGT